MYSIHVEPCILISSPSKPVKGEDDAKRSEICLAKGRETDHYDDLNNLSQFSLHPVHILAIAVMGLFKPKKPSQYPSTILWFFDQVSLCIWKVKLMVDTRNSNSFHSPCSYPHPQCPRRMVLHRCSRILPHRSVIPPLSSLTVGWLMK